jgi:catechol 2,3-dioxygenase-like lactoylglutathione lyase family enzyme
MYDHIGLKVKDLAASIRFYEAALAPLGHELGSHDDTCAGLGPKGAPALWLYAARGAQGPGTHIALRAANHEAVDAFYQAGLKAGAQDNGGPGPRPDYSPTYYAAFLIDPDGNNVEAVCP